MASAAMMKIRDGDFADRGWRWNFAGACVWRRGRTGRFGCRSPGHGRDESVSSPWDSFDVLRGAGTVVQRLANAIDRFIQRLIEVNEGVSPDLFLDLLARDDFARPLGQHEQNPKRLFLKADKHATLAQLHGVAVQFVDSEGDPASHLVAPCCLL